MEIPTITQTVPQDVPMYFFHRSQDQAAKTGYKFEFDPDNGTPSKVKSALTDIHSKLAARLNDGPDTLWVALAVGDEIDYTVAACFSKPLGSERRPFLRMLAAAVASDDLRAADIDPIEFLRTVAWDDYGKWTAFARVELRKWLDRPSMKEPIVNELVQSRDGRLNRDREDYLSEDEQCELLSKAIRRMDAEQRYRHEYAFNATEKLKLPFKPKYVLYEKPTAKAKPKSASRPDEETNSFDSVIADLNANNKGPALQWCQNEAYDAYWLNVQCNRQSSYRPLAKLLKDFQSKAKDVVSKWRACKIRDGSVAELEKWATNRSGSHESRLQEIGREVWDSMLLWLILGIIAIVALLFVAGVLIVRHVEQAAVIQPVSPPPAKTQPINEHSKVYVSAVSKTPEKHRRKRSGKKPSPPASALTIGGHAPNVNFTPLGAKQAIDLSQYIGGVHPKAVIIEFASELADDNYNNVEHICYLTNQYGTYSAVFSPSTTRTNCRTYIQSLKSIGYVLDNVGFVVGQAATKAFETYGISGSLPQVLVIGKDGRIVDRIMAGPDGYDTGTLDDDVVSAIGG